MQEDEEEEDLTEEEEAEQRPALAFFGGRGQQGLATQAERSFKAQAARAQARHPPNQAAAVKVRPSCIQLSCRKNFSPNLLQDRPEMSAP